MDNLLSQGRNSFHCAGAVMKRVVAALIFKDGKILVCQRTRHQTMPLKWEFPGGKIEEGEQPRDALRRELDEELGIDASVGDEVARIRHQYKSGSSVELRFFVVNEYKGELENKIFRDMRWSERSELPSFDFLEADLELVKDLAAGKIA
jgi:8-oxo-dGTP diphosphatase